MERIVDVVDANKQKPRTHLDSVVLIDGYGLRKPDAAEYIDGVCHDAAVISGLSIG